MHWLVGDVTGLTSGSNPQQALFRPSLKLLSAGTMMLMIIAIVTMMMMMLVVVVCDIHTNSHHNFFYR